MIVKFFNFIKLIFGVKTSVVNHQDMDLPLILLTRQDFETVLNYFLMPDNYELKDEFVDGICYLTILLNQSISKKRINIAKKYINEHKLIYIQVEYK